MCTPLPHRFDSYRNRFPLHQYYAIFLESRQLGYEVAQGTWGSALNAAQWLQLEVYQQQFSVRSTALYSWPGFDGVVPAAAGLPTTLAAVSEVFAENDGAFLSTANGGGPINTIHSWVTPADVSNAPSVEEVARFHSGDANDEAGQGGSAMAVQRLASGAERLHFFFIPTVYHPSQIAVLNLAIQWTVRGLFLGERRINLGMQIDDLFLATPEWSLANPIDDDDVEGGTRISAEDLDRLAAYQLEASQQLPSGSAIRYEWALNGLGVDEAGGIDNDGLAQGVQQHRESFFYVHHTYTHPNLDDHSEQQCQDEITQNSAFVEDLWGETPPSTWGPHDLVPPSISGLFNGPCLEGLQSVGINSEVGDNSRPELIPWSSLYHGIWTDAEINGADNTFIIPRFATNIFYNNAIPQNNLDHFNTINAGWNWSWEDLMEYEGDTVARWLLQWRHDPYMFHQSNAFSFERSGWDFTDGWASLMALWTQTVIDHLKPYTALPVVSWRQAEMKTRLIARMARDSCGIDARVVVQDGVGVQVVASAGEGGDCHMALSGVKPEATTQYASESAGPEFTVYVHLRHGDGERTIATGFEAPAPQCSPLCDATHGVCVTDADPPACECDIGWGGIDCSSPVDMWGANAISDAGFEVVNSLGVLPYWYDFGLGGVTISGHDTWNGNNGAQFTASSATEAHGVYQIVWLGQSYPADVRISGWSEAVGVSGIKDGFYSIYADIVHTDGSWRYGVTAPFDTGSHGWQYAETVFTPEKPVETMWLYVMFSYHSGTVNFDDVNVQQMVPPEGGPVTTDGRCGFNSPQNAVCRTGSCCSDAGWCQSSCGTSEDVEYEECQTCWGTTSGPCKTADGVCWPLVSEGPFVGTCPAGSVACDEIPSLDDEAATVVEAEIVLVGITEPALSTELQGVVGDTVAGEAGTTGGAVADVEPSFAADEGVRRRLSRVGSESWTRRRLSTGLSAAQCQVMALGTNAVRVRIILAAGADGPAGSDIVANVKHSLDSGSLEAALTANGLGVTPQLVGEPQIVPQTGATTGIEMGTFSGAVVAAAVLGLCVGAVGVSCRRSDGDYVSRVDRAKVGKSDSVRKIQLPRLASTHKEKPKDGQRRYDAVGPAGERGTLLHQGAGGEAVEAVDEPIGTVTPRDDDV